MFTGIVEAVGEVREILPSGKAVRLRIAAPALFADTGIGDSVAVNGVCLTITSLGEGAARFDAVPETLQRTSLGRLRRGSPVNLERALRASDRLGGHIVQGHVDATGTVRSIERAGEAYLLSVEAPGAATDFLVEKGSVAIDGVSLTVARLDPDGFAVALIPHTLAVTTLGRLGPGDVVNVEADILGKYVARFLARRSGPARSDEALVRLLQDEGYA